MVQRAIPVLIVLGLILAGCTKNPEQPQYTQVTLSIYDSPTYNYDSVLASITMPGDTLWLGQLQSSGGYFEHTVHVNPGVTYTARGWAFKSGLLCFNSNISPTFSLSQGQAWRQQINLNPLPPPPPTNLTAASGLSSGVISLSWQHNGSLLQGFQVEHGLSGNPLTLVTTLPAYARSYQDIGLTPGQLYLFRVRAYNPAGPSAYSNVDSAYAP
jgi:hypothetical protein